MSTAVAKARPVENRVQGIESSLSDLTLHDGRELAVVVGGSILKTPTLKRTIGGASSISLSVDDPDGDLIQSSLFGEKFEAELDDLWFRLQSIDSDEPIIALTLEERAVAKLRELKGPLKVYAKRGQPDEVTRAEFIINSLIKSVKPAIPYFCLELHKRQPIETKAQGKAAQAEAKANRGKGIGDSKGLKVKGESADAGQQDVIDRALRVADHDRAPFRVRVALVAALIDESVAGQLSANVLQMTPETAASAGFDPSDVEAAAHGFLAGYINGEGGAIAFYKHNPSAEPADIATAVQRNRDGASSYAPFVAEAREWVEAFEGGEFGGGDGETEVEPRVWEVRKGEDYWEAIKRLAKEVNWRAFFVAGRFFFIDEMELYRGMVRLAIDRDTPGIQKIAFKYRVGAPVTEITITAYADQWSVPPGAVITLAEYGPASLGFGDAPVKANSKGQKAGLSSNRKAATGEGRARYLVESIECDLRDDEADARLVTIKARKPTAPLPEPAAKTKTASSGGTAGGTGEMGTLEGTPEDIVNQVVDYAHSHGFPDVTRESVRAANAAHGPTISGSVSDHQGPPNVRWAADISNGVSTPEEAKLAAAIAEAFDIPYHGTLKTGELAEATHSGYRFQLIHNTMTGGDHFNHVHFGCAVA